MYISCSNVIVSNKDPYLVHVNSDCFGHTCYINEPKLTAMYLT